MRLGLLVLTVSCGLAMAGSALMNDVALAAESGASSARVLRHIVMYKFRDDLAPAQVQEVIDAFKTMVRQIDSVVGFEHGLNTSKEGKSDGLTHIFVVTFRDEAGRDAYLAHPAHAAYVKVAKDKREKVIVADYWAEK